jgi:hypothetical protein
MNTTMPVNHSSLASKAIAIQSQTRPHSLHINPSGISSPKRALNISAAQDTITANSLKKKKITTHQVLKKRMTDTFMMLRMY